MQGGSSTAGMHLRTTEPVISGVDSGASGQTPVQGNNDKLELQRFAALFEARKDSIMKVYRSPGELVYHGTTKDNKRRIQEIGFRKTKKLAEQPKRQEMWMTAFPTQPASIIISAQLERTQWNMLH